MKQTAVAFLLLTILVSCGLEKEKTEPLKNISYNSTGEFELGTLDSTRYHNNYFGFSIDCAKDKWLILNADRYSQRSAIQKKSLNVAEDTWDRTANNLHNLLTIEKKLNDSTTNRMQSISFTGEGLENIPNVNSALEYIEYTKKYCEENFSTNYPIYTVKGIDTAEVGNRTFLVLSLEVKDSPFSKRFQKNYCAQFGKYLLDIIITYSSEEELKENEKILTEVTWD
jgi:hypothetical protein